MNKNTKLTLLFSFFHPEALSLIIPWDQEQALGNAHKPSIARFQLSIIFFANKCEAVSSETGTGRVLFVRLLILVFRTQYCLCVHSNSLFNLEKHAACSGGPQVSFE